MQELNGTSDAAKKFSVDPSVQQTLEEKMQESSSFLQSINIIGVSEQEGEKLGLGVAAAEAELEQLPQEDPQRKEGVTAPELGALIKRKLLDLESALTGDIKRARRLVADLYGEIHIVQEEDGVYAEYDNAAAKLIVSASGMPLCVVAGVGLEPTTFGL